MKENSWALVTGASSGIGQEVCKALSREGFAIIGLGRNAQGLEQTGKSIQTKFIPVIFDLNQPDQIFTKLSPLIQEQLPQLKVLINNAGYFHRSKIEEATTEELLKIWNINFLAPFELIRLVLPMMKINRQGSIVNITTTLALRPTPMVAAYSAAKAALNNLTLSVAVECGPDQIRCNAIAPGIVETPIHGLAHMNEEQRRDFRKRCADLQPLGRIGQPEEIAELVSFIAGPRSAWTTGAIIPIDGGINIK